MSKEQLFPLVLLECTYIYVFFSVFMWKERVGFGPKKIYQHFLLAFECLKIDLVKSNLKKKNPLLRIKKK